MHPHPRLRRVLSRKERLSGLSLRERRALNEVKGGEGVFEFKKNDIDVKGASGAPFPSHPSVEILSPLPLQLLADLGVILLLLDERPQ